ncbi:MAG TPA: SCO1664 family protein [Euzebya sp.]|nr:SCO1664 family protein [Euzebya sp.]
MSAHDFDPRTVGFVASHASGCALLADAELDPLGFIADASNGAMLCRLGDPDDNRYVIYKPEAHERPLWDFPGSLYLREVAAYAVSEFLGWGLVPPTVLRDGPRGPGSVQLFVPHDPAQHYFELVTDRVWERELTRLAVFDMVTNNADRKGGHVLLSTHDPRLYGIDNGLTFHAEPKLRTVVWDLAHVPFQPSWAEDLRRLQACLAEEDHPFADDLHELLTTTEVRVLARRAGQVAGMTRMPDIHPDERWYPWPPI